MFINLGVHVQRGLRYLVCKCVCPSVRLSVSYLPNIQLFAW